MPASGERAAELMDMLGHSTHVGIVILTDERNPQSVRRRSVGNSSLHAGSNIARPTKIG